MNEWVADFALAGQAPLDGPDWASRMVLFRLLAVGCSRHENTLRARDEAVSEKFDLQKRARLLLRD